LRPRHAAFTPVASLQLTFVPVILVPVKSPVKVPPESVRYFDTRFVPASCKFVVAFIVVPFKVPVKVPPANFK
jgi:hypothetical protein